MTQQLRNKRTWLTRTSTTVTGAVLLLTAVWWGCGRHDADSHSQTARVQRQDMFINVVGQGKVESEFNRSVTPPRSWGLQIATLAPEGSPWIRTLKTVSDEISKKTNNQVRFKIYPGGILGDEKDISRSVIALPIR